MPVEVLVLSPRPIPLKALPLSEDAIFREAYAQQQYLDLF